MKELKDMKIYIVDMDSYTCRKLEEQFCGVSNVQVVHSDIKRFYRENKDKIDCLVSPANAFGMMTGGYDAALSEILGWDFQYKVQDYIKENFYGEQGVGTSFIIKTDVPNLSLIHTPTMQYPSKILNDIKSIVIPVFGGACGCVKPEITSKRLKDAYMQILNNIGVKYRF